MLTPLEFVLNETQTRSAYTIRNAAERLTEAVSFDEETDDPRTHFPRQALSLRASPLDVRSVISPGLTAPSGSHTASHANPPAVAAVRRPAR